MEFLMATKSGFNIALIRFFAVYVKVSQTAKSKKSTTQHDGVPARYYFVTITALHNAHAVHK